MGELSVVAAHFAEVIGETHRLWDRLPEQIIEVRADVEPGQFECVYALARHVRRLTPEFLSIIEHATPDIAHPTLRLMHEAAVTAQWLSLQGGAAVSGFLKEGARQRRSIANGFISADWPGATTELVDLAVADYDRLEAAKDLENSAAKFGALCDDLIGGARAYTIYRLLCRRSHAGLGLVDLYVTEDGIRSDPDDGDAQFELHTAAWAPGGGQARVVREAAGQHGRRGGRDDGGGRAGAG